MTIVQSINDITRQARQGSVAAIIQILNDRLADNGVRTRAVLAQGILQLLCEADNARDLDKDSLVSRIQGILEYLRPRHIQRVRINSRLVREQQLLWLEEIQKDPEGHLLWSAEIRLPPANPIRFLIEDIAFLAKQHRDRIPTASAKFRQQRARQQFWRGIIGGTGLSLFVLVMGWVLYDWMSQRGDRSIAESDLGSSTQSLEATENQSSGSTQQVLDATAGAQSSSSEISSDAFAQAVAIAEQAVADGQTATTPAEWLDLASRWQRASDLMSEVSVDDNRFATAQDRQNLYQSNSEQALNQADAMRSQSPESQTE
ncbi:MAG: hypothetical protein WBA57_13000 [Elainellaceae cyanobacterium]